MESHVNQAPHTCPASLPCMHCHQHADFTWSEKMLDAGLPIAAVAVRHCSEPTLLTKCCCSPSFLAMAPQLIRNPIKRVISHFYFGRKLRFHDCMLDHQTVSSFLKNEDGCRAITTTITGDGQSGVWWFGGKAPWMARGAGGLSVPVLLSPWSCSLVLFWFLPFFFFFVVAFPSLPARSWLLPVRPLCFPCLRSRPRFWLATRHDTGVHTENNWVNCRFSDGVDAARNTIAHPKTLAAEIALLRRAAVNMHK